VASKIFFAAHNVNPVQDYYICKPDSGLSITGVNFFQDESFHCLAVVPGGQFIFQLLFLTSAKQNYQQWHGQTE
jgi:hypothetical protein